MDFLNFIHILVLFYSNVAIHHFPAAASAVLGYFVEHLVLMKHTDKELESLSIAIHRVPIM